MNKEETQKQYDEIQKQIGEIDIKIKPLNAEKYRLRKAQEKIYFENELWHNIDELKQYANKDIEALEIVYREKGKAEIETEYLCGDILCVKEDGTIYYSDYQDGIISYCEKNGCYIWAYHYSITKLEILGFTEISLWDD